VIIRKFIFPLTANGSSKSAGQKGLSIQKMMKYGLPVPKTYFCDWKVFQRYIAGEKNLLSIIKHELENIIDPKKNYAIRSSANLEDKPDYSFAGQFETVLNVNGVPAILDAIEKVWLSTQTDAIETYMEQHGVKIKDIKMAVLIQEMVTPLYSGVALSKNPVNGGDEIVVEAVRGEGTRIVQDGHTPERWIYKWGYWIEKSGNEDIPLSLIEKVVLQLDDLAKRVDYPIDTEWVYDGDVIYWLQMREISTMRKRNIYSNHLAREMFPGMIKPLIFSIGASIMGESVQHWLEEILGPLPFKPEELIKSVYYRAYFNMGALGTIFKKFGFPAESMEMLMGALPRGAGKTKLKPSFKTFSLFPRAFAFFIKKTFFQKIARKLDHLENKIQKTAKKELRGLGIAELYDAVNCHYRVVQEVAYCTSLSLFLLTMYNQVLKRQLARRNIKLSDFDITENMPELDSFYPFHFLHKLNLQYQRLPSDWKIKIKSGTLFEHEENGLKQFSEQYKEFIEKFGHLGDCGNDFSVPPWRETPEVVLKMITDYEPPDQNHKKKINLKNLKACHQVNPIFKLFYNRAREFLYLRERSSNLYTRGKVLFRYFYLAIGDHFVRSDLIEKPEDIFYLTPIQIKQLAFGKKHELSDIRAEINRHKSDMERYKNIQLPSVIYGDESPLVCESEAEVLIGVPASQGFYTGHVCVVKSETEFSKLKRGEVLVIPYSDVSWSSLFARAGALISESGGLLSHGSIVAREYNLPAIVSVDKATNLKDGTLVRVDAHQGIIQVLGDT